MSESSVTPAATSATVGVDAVLQGGPANLPAEHRVVRMAHSQDKIKIKHYGGYEHFERANAAEDDGPGPVVFRWVGRTCIAE